MRVVVRTLSDLDSFNHEDYLFITRDIEPMSQSFN